MEFHAVVVFCSWFCFCDFFFDVVLRCRRICWFRINLSSWRRRWKRKEKNCGAIRIEKKIHFTGSMVFVEPPKNWVDSSLGIQQKDTKSRWRRRENEKNGRVWESNSDAVVNSSAARGEKVWTSKRTRTHSKGHRMWEKVHVDANSDRKQKNSVRQSNTFFHVNDVNAKEFIEPCNHPFHIFGCVIQWCLWRAIVKPVHMFLFFSFASQIHRTGSMWNLAMASEINVFMKFYRKQVVTQKNKRDGALVHWITYGATSMNRKLHLIEVICTWSTERYWKKWVTTQCKYSELIAVDKFWMWKKEFGRNRYYNCIFQRYHMIIDYCFLFVGAFKTNKYLEFLRLKFGVNNCHSHSA